MNTMKKHLFILLAITFVLSGCFEVDQSLIIKKNGSTEYKVTMVVDQSLLLLSDISEEEICNSSLSQGIDIGSFMVSSREFRRGEDIGCTYEMKGPFEDFFILVSSGNLDAAFNAPGSGPSKKNKTNSQELLSIEKISNNRYRIKSLISSDEYDSAPKDKSSEDNPFGELDSFFKKSLGVAFRGRKFIFSLESPKIINSSHSITNDGKKTRVEVPMSNLLNGKDIYFESTFQLDEFEEDPFSNFLK